MSARACIWCAHPEGQHSAIFGECQGILSDWSPCTCAEFVALHPAPKPERHNPIGLWIRIAWHWMTWRFWAAIEWLQRVERGR